MCILRASGERPPGLMIARDPVHCVALDSAVYGRRIARMKWETPAFVEINMSAEIGGYGSDFTDRDPWGPVATVEAQPRANGKTERDATDAVRR
jgi:hypothetical protein